MRNFIFGFIAALVVAGAVVAGILYVPRLTARPPSAPLHPTARVAPSSKPAFVGEKRFGAWTLVCRKLPPPPSYRPAPPLRPCTVETRVQISTAPANVISANYSVRGPVGVLLLMFRVPETLIPDKPAGLVPTWAAGPGGLLDLQWSAGSHQVAATYCAPPDCKASMVVQPDEETKFLATQKLVLVLPAFPGKTPPAVNFPVDGMAAAVAAMRRLEK